MFVKANVFSDVFPQFTTRILSCARIRPVHSQFSHTSTPNVSVVFPGSLHDHLILFRFYSN